MCTVYVCVSVGSRGRVYIHILLCPLRGHVPAAVNSTGQLEEHDQDQDVHNDGIEEGHRPCYLVGEDHSRLQ